MFIFSFHSLSEITNVNVWNRKFRNSIFDFYYTFLVRICCKLLVRFDSMWTPRPCLPYKSYKHDQEYRVLNMTASVRFDSMWTPRPCLPCKSYKHDQEYRVLNMTASVECLRSCWIFPVVRSVRSFLDIKKDKNNIGARFLTVTLLKSLGLFLSAYKVASSGTIGRWRMIKPSKMCNGRL